MAAVTIYSNFGAQANKVCHCFHSFSTYLPWSDGTDAMILVFWMLSFKPTFSLSSFTFIKRLYSSSSLSAIRLVSSAYLRLLIFLLAILILACASSCHFSLKSVYVRMHFGKYYLILIHLPAEITWQLKRNDKITVFCILMVSGRSINSTS